ncbi:MAG: dihydroorotase family protein [Anaerolineae bacterium]|nr:dihydroorotase family protein [Anaerolineae bacterium]
MSTGLRLLRGGLVATPEGVMPGDILVQGEWIVAVGPDLEASGATVVHCGGLVALPGAVDAHVHLREPGAEHKEDFTTGTRAALAGGYTTVLDMPNSPVPTSSLSAFAAKADLARAKACCDFGLFFGATPANMGEATEVAGAVGLKLYMGSSTGDLLVADLAHQYRHFASYPRDRILAVHAEDEEAVRTFSEEERRPPICAELAVARAIALARRTGRRLHVCHVSTAAELDAIRLARAQGLAVTCEVTPHHLFLNRTDEARLGPLALMNPPLRSPEDQEALWERLDEVDIVASDHAPHTLEEKSGSLPPAGVPGLETTLPLLLDAVAGGRLSLPHLVRLTAARPAALYRLPHKGRLAPGYHADIALIELQSETALGTDLKTKCGWSPFQGRRVRGRIVRVILRGEDAMVEGELLADPGRGRLVTPRPS